jgi:hypothetical protein
LPSTYLSLNSNILAVLCTDFCLWGIKYFNGSLAGTQLSETPVCGDNVPKTCDNPCDTPNICLDDSFALKVLEEGSTDFKVLNNTTDNAMIMNGTESACRAAIERFADDQSSQESLLVKCSEEVDLGGNTDGNDDFIDADESSASIIVAGLTWSLIMLL